jgi:hypothetical protein
MFLPLGVSVFLLGIAVTVFSGLLGGSAVLLLVMVNLIKYKL